jgi:hypothetical protein
MNLSSANLSPQRMFTGKAQHHAQPTIKKQLHSAFRINQFLLMNEQDQEIPIGFLSWHGNYRN